MKFGIAFPSKAFTEFLSLHGINAISVPARLQNKNVIESKLKVIRDIFLRIKSKNADLCEIVAVKQAIHISNDLYGNDTFSAPELAKGFTRPIVPGIRSKIVPKDPVMTREIFMAERKLNLILKSKSTSGTRFQIGDLVQVFIKLQHEKQRKWSNPRPVLSHDK